jgi:IPT/TIG domain/Calx-beta domain
MSSRCLMGPRLPAGNHRNLVSLFVGVATIAASLVLWSPPASASGAPTVANVSPNAGPTSGGTSVTITGTNLAGTSAVDFGGTLATSFAVDSDTSISAVSPPASAGTIDVTVTTTDGTSTTTAADEYSFVATPTVTGVNPASGPTTGGTSVTITGTSLTGASAVDFGGTAAASFSVDSDTSISAVSPAHSAGAIDVTVTTAGGTSESRAKEFTFFLARTCANCISVGDQSMLEGDSGTHLMQLPVTLSEPAWQSTVTVQYTVTGSSATGGTAQGPGVDFKLKSGTLTFTSPPGGELTPIRAFVTLLIFGDTTVEPDETLTVSLSNPTGGYVLGRSSGTGTILNDDGVASGPTVGVGDAAIVGQRSGNQVLAIPVTLSTNAGTVHLHYSITPGSATYSATAAGGGDFGGKTQGDLKFQNGPGAPTMIRVPVSIWADPNLDTDETFTITLSALSGTNVTLIRPMGTGSILGLPLTPGPPVNYYLALGDSVPVWNGTQSYPNLIAGSPVVANVPNLQLVNLARIGETTTSMLGTPPSSQYHWAIDFLDARPGEVALVTIDIGGNDAEPCVSLTGIDPVCAAAALGAIQQNMTTMLAGLRDAVGSSTPIVGMNYFDPFLGNWLEGLGGQMLAETSVQGLVTLNTTLGDLYAQAGDPVANVQDAFHSTDLTTIVVGTPWGDIPIAVERACSLLDITCVIGQFEFGGDDPSVDGAAVIAQAFEDVIGVLPPPG